MFTREQLHKIITRRLVGVPFASQDARQIVMHAAKCSHSDFIARPEEKVGLWDTLRALFFASQRQMHVPMAYLLGKRSFYGRDFCVRRGVVLIPRPETELIVDEAIAMQEDRPLYIDIGTGCGAIAVSLAAETGQPVIGTDTSVHAVRVANHNAERLGVSHLTEFREGPLVAPVHERELGLAKCVVITANLPYLSKEMLDSSPIEVSRHEPIEALVSDSGDGLDLYRFLFERLKYRRADFGENLRVIIEIDPRQRGLIEDVVRVFHPYAEVEIKNDLAGLARVVVIRL